MTPAMHPIPVLLILPVMNHNFASVVDIGYASFAGVNDTGNACIAGVVVTGNAPNLCQ
jgi:hypothetical protein